MSEYILDEWPPEFDLKLYRGDSFGDDWRIEIPDLSGETDRDGNPGPHDLSAEGVSVTAEIRTTPDAAAPAATFDVIVEDGPNRIVRPYLTRTDTASLRKDGFWDLQVSWGATGTRTILQGRVTLGKDKTRA